LEFDKLEIIGDYAFHGCKSLQSINMHSIRRVGENAFDLCTALTEAIFGEKLERIGGAAFQFCTPLQRIVIPLKHVLLARNDAFYNCGKLVSVDILDEGIHETIYSLHMESWRDEMEEEIDRINQTLLNMQRQNRGEKARAIAEWIESVLQRMEHYKSEHQIILKDAMTMLELALWKAKLLNEAGEKKCNVNEVIKKVNIDTEAARKEHRVTCGAK
jgi:hypothetical protein